MLYKYLFLKMASEVLTHTQRVLRLYRNSLRHSLSWIIDRQSWRVEALKLRARFDANKGIRDMRLATKLLEEGEAEFNASKHPDPYIGSFYILSYFSCVFF